MRRAEADGLAVLDGSAPVGVRMRGGEVVVRVVVRVRDDAVGVGRLRIDLIGAGGICLLYTSPSPRDQRGSRMPSSA